MLLTGHGIFKYHLFNMGITEDKSCRFCEDEVETSSHLLCICPKYAYHRWLFFDKAQMTPEEMLIKSFRILLAFMMKSGIIKDMINFDIGR